jgi:hypothetical protein
MWLADMLPITKTMKIYYFRNYKNYIHFKFSGFHE